MVKRVWGVVVGFLLSVESWLVDSMKARYGVAVARVLLGVTGVGLVLTQVSTLRYTFGAGSAWSEQRDLPTSEFPLMPLFGFFRSIAYDSVAVYVYIAVLVVFGVLFTVGFRTKLVQVCYFVMHVGFIESQNIVHDQGDNMWRIAMIVLFFAASSDVLSVDAWLRRRGVAKGRLGVVSRVVWGVSFFPAWWRNVFHNLAVIVLGAQVSFVYVSGALYKAGGEPWSGGYAVYNPLMVRQFSPWPQLVEPLMVWGPVVAVITYGAVLAQLAFPFMLLQRWTRILSLIAIGGFHLGIAVFMGLPWFSLAMIAVDSIFIRDRSWQKLITSITKRAPQKTQKTTTQKTRALGLSEINRG